MAGEFLEQPGNGLEADLKLLGGHGRRDERPIGDLMRQIRLPRVLAPALEAPVDLIARKQQLVVQGQTLPCALTDRATDVVEPRAERQLGRVEPAELLQPTLSRFRLPDRTEPDFAPYNLCRHDGTPSSSIQVARDHLLCASDRFAIRQQIFEPSIPNDRN